MKSSAVEYKTMSGWVHTERDWDRRRQVMVIVLLWNLAFGICISEEFRTHTLGHNGVWVVYVLFSTSTLL